MDAETLLLAASLIAERTGDDVKLRTDAMQSMLDDAVRKSPVKDKEALGKEVKPSPYRNRGGDKPKVKPSPFRDRR